MKLGVVTTCLADDALFTIVNTYLWLPMAPLSEMACLAGVIKTATTAQSRRIRVRTRFDKRSTVKSSGITNPSLCCYRSLFHYHAILQAAFATERNCDRFASMAQGRTALLPVEL